MVEFALVAPLLLLVLVGIFEFGRTFNYWIDSTHLANETARWAAVNYAAPSGLCNATCVTNKQQLLYYTCSNATNQEMEQGLGTTIDFSKNQTSYTTSSTGMGTGDSVRVTISKTMSFPLVGGMLRTLGGSSFGNITIRGRSTMRLEQTPTNYVGGTLACP